ncbi:hypothetical protein P7C73_g4594, partial [Tremellales sp. Uapishka_1]
MQDGFTFRPSQSPPQPLASSSSASFPHPSSHSSRQSYPSPKSLHLPILPLEQNGTPNRRKSESTRRLSFKTVATPSLAAFAHPSMSALRAEESPPKRDFTESTPELDKEELTTKGRKRKRLAKACSACHKNKRRCDGFAPCSNCEFSSRPCLYVNAQGDLIPPPRTRDSSISPINRNGRDDEKPSTPGTNGQGSRPSDDRSRRGSMEGHNRNGGGKGDGDRRYSIFGERRHVPSPLEVVEADPAIAAEFIDIFFKRVQPYGALLHSPTFHHRLFLNRVSPLLLDVIYAFSARLSENPTFLASLPPEQPPWLRGEAFADRAKASIERIVDIRRRWSEEERRLDRGTWEETEFAQALCLLSIYTTCLRQIQLGLFYLDLGLSILRPTGAGSLIPPSMNLGLPSIEYQTLAEIRSRTFWFLVLEDIFAAAHGRPRRLSEQEMCNVPLPASEVHWVRYGGGAAGGREPGRRDGIAPGSGNWKGEEGMVGELGYTIRILSIFCEIVALASSSPSTSTGHSQHTANQYEQALKGWAASLPRDLRFDEVNLANAVARLHSPVTEISLSGYLYAYMHAVAECGMFYLQATGSLRGGANASAARQSQAVDNLGVIIGALGERGREGPLVLFPLLVVTNWQDHIRSSSTSPSPQQLALDENLNQWWFEIRRGWGLEREPVTERGFFYPTPSRTSISHSSPRLPERAERQSGQSGLGLGLNLYQLHPQSHSPTDRFQAPHALPPLRPRAATISAPSFPFYRNTPTVDRRSPLLTHRRQLPSMSGPSSESNEKISLPPLNRFDPYKKEESRSEPLLGIAALVSAAEEREKMALE